MTQITEDNKLIAEFMNAHGEIWPDKMPSWCDNFTRMGRWDDSITAMMYHESWDWLMPVIEKMEGMGYCLTSDPWSHQLIEYGTGDECVVVETQFDSDNSKIKELYIIVIEFIKWYNQHGK